MNREQRMNHLRKKILLLLITRRMLGVETKEDFLRNNLKETDEMISEALLYLTEESAITKVGNAFYELTEEGASDESVYLANLLAKMSIWCE
jgi:hypothetical protein